MVRGTWAKAGVGEDLAEVGWSAEGHSGFIFMKLWVMGVYGDVFLLFIHLFN